MPMKDKNDKPLKKGDTVSCHGLEFVIEEFKKMKSGEPMACGKYGCFNTDVLEKVKKEKTT